MLSIVRHTDAALQTRSSPPGAVLHSRLGALLIAVAGCLMPPTAFAGLIFTDEPAFLTAAPGATSVVDFDSVPAGTTIANGGTLGGVTFDYSLTFGTTLEVRNDFDTSSGENSLGTDDGDDLDLLADGDQITFTFAGPLAGFGLTIIGVGADQLDGDYTLTFGGDTAVFDVDAVQQTFGDGGSAWFLGVTFNDGSTFSTATLTADSGFDEAFFFNVDDLTLVAAAEDSPVPEPSSIVLLGLGLAGIALRTRRRRSAHPLAKSTI